MDSMESPNSKSSKFFALYTNTQGRLYSYLLMMVHNRDDADELLQETAAIMWERFDQFQEGTNFGAWAIKIAKNKSYEHLRKNKSTKMLLNGKFYEDISDFAEKSSEEIPVRLQALNNCINKLNTSNQKLLRLRYKKGLSIKDISQATGRSCSALYKNLASILRLLRICIERTLLSQRA